MRKVCAKMISKLLQQDNAPAHNALSVKQFLANKNITVLEHPLYSPDITPCDFYLFPKIKCLTAPLVHQCSKKPILCRWKV
jgi:histone-lysine N-methyltransferase SETMAR